MVLTECYSSQCGAGVKPAMSSNGGGGVASVMRHLGSGQGKLEVGRAIAATKEGCALFYKGEGAGTRSIGEAQWWR
jgi:hypothetical protein